MSRRSKFNPHTMNAILEAISIGCTFELAAERAGISRQTLYNWILQGKKAKHGKFYNFVQQLKRAESRSAVAALATLQRQLLQVLSQLRSIDAEAGQLDDNHHLSDDQLMDDITAVIVSLPPLARQRIINDLQSLSATNIIPINQKK